jgi:hypothetical protein
MNNAASFKANQFASSAEDFLSKGDFQNACTSHFRAAEQFLLAMNDTKDPEVLFTLILGIEDAKVALCVAYEKWKGIKETIRIISTKTN